MMQFEIFAGIDWSAKVHQVAVADAGGEVLGEQAFAHSGDGLAAMADWILECESESGGRAAVAIEKPHGPEVDALLERGIAVFALNPKQLDRFRDRFSPAGAKDDRRDALVLADSLATDRKAFREVDALSPDAIRLRELSRAESDLVAERTCLINKLTAQLRRYYPAFLDAAPDLGRDWALNLWNLAPTPEKARRVRKSSVEAVLRKSRARASRAEDILAVLRGKAVPTAPGTVEAVAESAARIVRRLKDVNAEIKDVRNRSREVLDRIKEAEGGRVVEILESVPGIGATVLAVIVSEAFDSVRKADLQALRCYFGVAPVTKRSGRTIVVQRRLAANRRLVNAAYHWAMAAIQRDAASRAKYHALRSRGHSHARALRSVADRFLNVVCKMIETGETFDPERRSKAALLNQKKNA